MNNLLEENVVEHPGISFLVFSCHSFVNKSSYLEKLQKVTVKRCMTLFHALRTILQYSIRVQSAEFGGTNPNSLSL